MNKEILHKELSYQIVGILYEVHKKLGRFCKHGQYCEAIEILLKQRETNYQREINFDINFGEDALKEGNRLDFFIKDIIPLEVKVKKILTIDNYAQMKRYLKATNRKLGIIVNFREKSIKPKRILNKDGKL